MWVTDGRIKTNCSSLSIGPFNHMARLPHLAHLQHVCIILLCVRNNTNAFSWQAELAWLCRGSTQFHHCISELWRLVRLMYPCLQNVSLNSPHGRGNTNLRPRNVDRTERVDLEAIGEDQ